MTRDHIDPGDRPESLQNLLGRTLYVDDLGESARLLHAVPVPTPTARGEDLRVDASAALALDPSVAVLTAADVPGENRISEADDEPLFADGTWAYRGQVAALVLAPDPCLARRAAALVRVEGRGLPPVLDPREAFARGELLGPPRTLRRGDPEAAFRSAAYVARGRADSGGQEHAYLETQAAVASSEEPGRMRVVSSTQGPAVVQRAVARVLGLPASAVDVEAPRLGGAFGGKEDQATPWACLTALGAWTTGRPVKLVLRRRDDLAMTGKRHPYSADFRVALAADGTFLGLEVDYYQNAGAYLDLSPGVLGRTLLHAAGAYRFPAVRAAGSMCRTNLPPFTAFRGFGGPQAFFVAEAAVAAASEASGIPAAVIQRRNLLRDGDATHYGQVVSGVRPEACWDRLADAAGKSAVLGDAAVAAHNRESRLSKRGAWTIPVAFGISFTKTMMNQAGALVHVQADGSVSVHTTAVEMGQGVARKIQVASARALGVPEARVAVQRTRTETAANGFPTAASCGSDLNGMAASRACAALKARLLGRAADLLGAAAAELDLAAGRVLRGGADAGLGWEELVAAAYAARVDLSEHGFYATPGIFYDAATETGSPFAYFVCGCCRVVAEVDVVSGAVKVVGAAIVHDGGTALDPIVDAGQAEGAFAQGLGWALLEDLRYGPAGELLTDSFSTYKLPDAAFMDFPLALEILRDQPNGKAVLGSRAVGEPPLMYGIAGYFAALAALKAARPGAGFYDLPLTGEKALGYLTGGFA